MYEGGFPRPQNALLRRGGRRGGVRGGLGLAVHHPDHYFLSTSFIFFRRKIFLFGLFSPPFCAVDCIFLAQTVVLLLS